MFPKIVFRALLLVSLCLVGLTIGCQHRPKTEQEQGSYIPKERPQARISPEEMIDMARRFAAERGTNLADYDVSDVVNPIVLLGRLCWSVHFIAKGLLAPDGQRLIAEGDSFTVYIDDQDGAMMFLGGM